MSRPVSRSSISISSRSALAALWIAAVAWSGCSQRTQENADTAEPASPVSLRILSPAAGETASGPDVEVQLQLTGYEVYFDSATGMGQHIHMILDNQPYIPHYSTAPFTFKGVAPGTHTIRAFPSREWHESIKAPTAFVMVTFNVENADGQNAPEAGAPLLTYSRPKGEYKGEMGKRILVDYWIQNCVIGPEAYRVRMRIDGTAQEFIKWEPYYLENLAPGEHAISLELIGPDGNPAAGVFNSTTRTFTVSP